jgi:hypothetical protein
VPFFVERQQQLCNFFGNLRPLDAQFSKSRGQRLGSHEDPPFV